MFAKGRKKHSARQERNSYFLRMPSQKRPEVDFDSLLTRGAKTYDSAVGEWWHGRSLDAAHRKAYAHIAESAAWALQVHGKATPRRVIDYACGSGPLLAPLRQVFPTAQLLGLDGSETLLAHCSGMAADARVVDAAGIFGRGKESLRLCKCVLPDFGMPAAGADAVVFAFPNLVPDDEHLHHFNDNGYTHKGDNSVAHMLARFREMDPHDEVPVSPPDELFDELMTQRVFSRHLRHLLRKGGILVRAEYTQAPREDLTDLTRWRMLFAEGALEKSIKGERSEVFFQFLGSQFRKSPVILDVFHQTGNPDDKRGGYMVSFYEAV